MPGSAPLDVLPLWALFMALLLGNLLLDEANAIGTSYLRAAMLPDTQSASIRHLLREYT